MAISLGVNEEDIITLDTPKDTKEEAIESKKIVDGKKLILVTTASHMKRASMLFKNLLEKASSILSIITPPNKYLI